jgi:hypothetical protein
MPEGDYNCRQAGQYDHGGLLDSFRQREQKEATFFKGAFILSFFDEQLVIILMQAKKFAGSGWLNAADVSHRNSKKI